MNNQIVKTFEGVDFSVVKEGDDIWWWGGEVAKMLGYVNHGDAITRHVDECGKRKVQKPTGVFSKVVSNYKSMAWQINEYGLYSLAFSSKLPLAKQFKRWVFVEVLPSIRKTGRYIKPKHNQLSLISENDLHYAVVAEIRKRWPGLLLVVPMGEMQDTSSRRIEAWKKGFKGGMPDLMITNLHKSWRGFCIELKNPGGTGTLSDKQRETLNSYRDEGWKVLVTDDLVECLFEIQEYVKGFMKRCNSCGVVYKVRHTCS